MDADRIMASLVLVSLLHELPRKVHKKIIFELLTNTGIKLNKEELEEMEEHYRPR